MKKIFITAYTFLYGVNRHKAIEVYRTSNQNYRRMIIQAFERVAI